MTKEEFYEKYGEARVKFSDYYKYTFYYSGVLPDGATIMVGYGGGSDEIYRHSVSWDHETSVGGLYPFQGEVYKNGVEVDSFYDY